MLHSFSFPSDIGWPQTHNFNRAIKNSFHYKLQLQLSWVIITLPTILVQSAFSHPDQEELSMVSSSPIWFISSLELQWDGLKRLAIAKLTKLIFLKLKLTRTFQFTNNALMKMTDHGLSKKKTYLEATVSKLFSTPSIKQLKTTIRKIRMIIFKEFTPTTFLETFFTWLLSNTLLPTPQTETITLSIKMKMMVTINPNLI